MKYRWTNIFPGCSVAFTFALFLSLLFVKIPARRQMKVALTETARTEIVRVRIVQNNAGPHR